MSTVASHKSMTGSTNSKVDSIISKVDSIISKAESTNSKVAWIISTRRLISLGRKKTGIRQGLLKCSNEDSVKFWESGSKSITMKPESAALNRNQFLNTGIITR